MLNAVLNKRSEQKSNEAISNEVAARIFRNDLHCTLSKRNLMRSQQTNNRGDASQEGDRQQLLMIAIEFGWRVNSC